MDETAREISRAEAIKYENNEAIKLGYEAGIITATSLISNMDGFENAVIDYVTSGGKVIFYGKPNRASERFLNLVGIDFDNYITFFVFMI